MASRRKEQDESEAAVGQDEIEREEVRPVGETPATQNSCSGVQQKVIYSEPYEEEGEDVTALRLLIKTLGIRGDMHYIGDIGGR